MNIIRNISPLIHQVDHRLAHAMRRGRRVLVEMRTPGYRAVLGPICNALNTRPHTDVWVTSECPDRIIPLVGGDRFLTHRQVEWRRFDLYLNADPWAAARLRRCAHRINFFHGVAGKYDLDNPVGLPMGFEHYDRVAFINRDRMQRYLDAGVVTANQARLIGYPKLDALASGQVDGRQVKEQLGLTGDRRTALYAPTYSPASSLHLAGEQIVAALHSAGLNVIIKLHDRSLDIDPRYNAGIDWRDRMQALERPGGVRYVEGPDATPYLAAADLMVTDHSSAGFEYLVLDRPLIVFDAPELPQAARINLEKVALLRSAATVVRTPAELTEAARRELADPARLSPQRSRVAREMFHQPGTATARAVALVEELLAPAANSAGSLERSREPQPLGGGSQ